MEVQQTPVNAETMPTPTPIVGGPSETMEAKPTTMTDDLLRFQAEKSKPVEKKAEPTETTPPAPVAVPVPQGEKGIFFNGRQYTQEEIANQLRERDELLAKAAVKEVTPPPVVATSKEDEELETMMYTDPKRYTQVMEDRAAKKALAHIDAQRKQEQVKTDFYNNYKDLRGNEDLVEYYATKMSGSLAKEAPEVALSKLAQAVRTRITALRGEKKATEELSSKPAVTAGATGVQSGAAPAAKGVEGMSFIEQLQRVQRRGKVKY